jgi:hypothetical protein
MNSFVRRHAACVIGVPTGFNRVLFRGTLRRRAFVSGLMSYLSAACVLLKEFKDHSMPPTERIKESSEAAAEAAGRPRDLPDPDERPNGITKNQNLRRRRQPTSKIVSGDEDFFILRQIGP